MDKVATPLPRSCHERCRKKDQKTGEELPQSNPVSLTHISVQKKNRKWKREENFKKVGLEPGSSCRAPVKDTTAHCNN